MKHETWPTQYNSKMARQQKYLHCAADQDSQIGFISFQINWSSITEKTKSQMETIQSLEIHSQDCAAYFCEFLFHLFPFGVATASHPPPSHFVLSLLGFYFQIKLTFLVLVDLSG